MPVLGPPSPTVLLPSGSSTPGPSCTETHVTTSLSSQLLGHSLELSSDSEFYSNPLDLVRFLVLVFPGGSVRNLPVMQGPWVQFLGQEDLWRREWLPFQSILEIPWIAEERKRPGQQSSCLKVGQS